MPEKPKRSRAVMLVVGDEVSLAKWNKASNEHPEMHRSSGVITKIVRDHETHSGISVTVQLFSNTWRRGPRVTLDRNWITLL